MRTPLPSVIDQKTKPYRPTLTELWHIFDLVNEYIFDNQLPKPIIEMKAIRYYGKCTGLVETKHVLHHARLTLYPKYFCIQWAIMIMAHEMAHQYQWDVDGPDRIRSGKRPLLSHGPTFFKFQKKLAQFGIPLRVKYCPVTWLQTQNNF